MVANRGVEEVPIPAGFQKPQIQIVVIIKDDHCMYSTHDYRRNFLLVASVIYTIRTPEPGTFLIAFLSYPSFVQKRYRWSFSPRLRC